jgi:polyhydroxybutyrate depolymerase
VSSARVFLVLRRGVGGKNGRSLRLLVATAIGVFVIGCATTATTQGPPSPSAAPSPQITATPGPTAAASPTPEAPRAAKEQPLIAVGDDVRRVDVLVPSQHATLAAGQAMPLLVLLHGNNQSPSAITAASGADQLAEREGLLVAVPPAIDRRWQALPAAGQPVTDSPDVTYVGGLIEQLTATYSVDPERVFVAGFSMGAVLSGRLACERADLVAAVTLVAGTDWGGECAPSRVVSVLVIYGTSDRIFSIDGAEAFADQWRGLDSCAGSPVTQALTDDAVVVTSADCAEGTAVHFVPIEGAGHQWFSEPSATELAWDFFTTHPPR